MMSAALTNVVAISGMISQVDASILGQENWARVQIGSGYYAGGSGPLIVVDSLTLYSYTPFTFGGSPVVMDSLEPGARDLLLTTSVSDVGNRRTVTWSMSTLDGSAIMNQSVVDKLTKSERYFLYFNLSGSPTDDQMVSPYSYAYSLLGLNGKQSLSTGTSTGLLYSGTEYRSEHSPAGPNFFNLTPRGYSMTYAYDIIPSTATTAILACGTVLMPRRRR
jgi:hypothetical protein